MTPPTFSLSACPPPSTSAIPFFLGHCGILFEPLVSFLSTDSMIRVGGDYQAQIPEVKPGMKEGEGGREGGWREGGRKRTDGQIMERWEDRGDQRGRNTGG